MQLSATFFIFLSVSILAVAQPDGWKMTDRFYGFRYQIEGVEGLQQKIVEMADSLACFGWAQRPRGSLIVGEVRCSKNNGPQIETFIRSIHQSEPSKAHIKVCY
jgi:hypothetical protein